MFKEPHNIISFCLLRKQNTQVQLGNEYRHEHAKKNEGKLEFLSAYTFLEDLS